ncbi:MAG: exosortase [Steroidobacteraceae bacterium]
MTALMVIAAMWGLDLPLHSVHRSWTGVYGHFAHGYLVLGMAAWLGLHYWRRSIGGPPTPGWLALPVLAGLIIALCLAIALAIDTAIQSLLPLILLAVIIAAFGWQTGRRLFWPVAFLYTAMPLWWLLNPLLQRLSALVANLLVGLTGVPAFVEGNRFHLPVGTMEVAAGCSGLSFFMSALALALFQSLMYLGSWKDRLKLLGVAGAMGLVSNWLRIYSLIVVAYATDMRHYLIQVDHLTYGWVLFLVCMWPVFWYGARLEKRGMALPKPVAVGVQGSEFRPWPVMAAGVLVAGLLLVPSIAQLQLQTWASRLPPAAELVTAGAETRNAWVYGDETIVPGAAEQRASFFLAGEPIWLYRAAAGGNSSPAKWPLNGPEALEHRWQPHPEDERKVGAAGGVLYEQHRGALGRTEVLMRSGSLVAGHPVNSRLAVKLATLRGLMQRRQDAVLWIVATPCNDDCRAAAERLDMWMGEHSGLTGGWQAAAGLGN